MLDVTAVMDLGVEQPRLELLPGFRFHPTDWEIVFHYLTPKVLDPFFSCLVIAEVELNKCEPWDLPSKSKMGEKEWWFFVHKDRRYPTGMRTNRATESGYYWKATGRDKEIFHGTGRAAVLVGMKKTLVFYLGRAPRGEKTPWVMHEYRLDGMLPAHFPRSAKDEWAVCRVMNKVLAANAPQTAGGPESSDFTGASSSTSGTAVPPEPDMGFYQVKTELAVPPEPQQTHCPYYVSMPAGTSGNTGSAGYSQYQAAGNQQDAIRKHCRLQGPSSSALLDPETEMHSLMPRQSSYENLDNLSSDPLMDYDNMWKYFSSDPLMDYDNMWKY